MADATTEEIQQLVAALDRGRQAWISGQLETTATEHMAQADDMIVYGPFGGAAVPALPAVQTRIAAQFHGGTGHTELVRAFANGDLLVLVLLEHNTVDFEGHPAHPWTLRTTQVFRRDGVRWLRLHRHADPLVQRRSLDATLALMTEAVP